MPASVPSRRGCRPTAATVGSRVCAARRSRCSPGSPWTTTSAWSAAAWPAHRRACSTPSPRRCNSTRPSAITSIALARESGTGPAAAAAANAGTVRPALQQVLDAITDAPAWIRNGRHDVLAMNQLARALYAPGACRPAPAGEHHPLRVPESRGGRAVLRRLRPDHPRCGRDAAPRGGSQPARRGPDRTGR